MAEGPLQGKAAIITGAASPIGLGHAMTVALGRAGVRVALLDINDAVADLAGGRIHGRSIIMYA